MLNFDTHAARPRISVGGPLPANIAESVGRVVIEAQRNAPAMCEVEILDDPNSTIMDNPLLRPGQSLKVEATSASEDPSHTGLGPLFDGEVVAVEAAFLPHGGRNLVLRGYDKSHRLHRKRRTQTYTGPDASIVSQVAQAAGLVARVDPTPGTNVYLCQRNQTDWEFLAERAREIGFEIGMSMGQLVFRRAGSDPAAGIPQRLDVGENLFSFRARATSAEQAQTTKVKAWDPMLKQDVLGMATPPVAENTPGDPTLLPMTIATRFGSTEDISTDTPFSMPPTAAIANASARRQHYSSASFEAEGHCAGNPAMVPGGKVRIGNAGTSFSGTYTLTTVRHVFDDGGFNTNFTVSGVHDRSLFGLTQPGAAMRSNGHGGGGANLGSPVIAKVSNTNDPMQAGRVKIELPWMDSAESDWAMVVSVGAGASRGLQVIPEVGDIVLVVFEQGDVRRPYVIGGVWNPQDRMPEPAATAVMNGQTNVRTFQTRAGHKLTFTDTQGTENITLETHRGSKLVIQEGPTAEIKLVDGNGNNEIAIDGATNKVTMKSMGDLEIKSTGTLKLEGTAGVEIKSSAQVKVEGAAGAELQGNGPVTIKSNAMLSLQGGATAELKGGIVRIN